MTEKPLIPPPPTVLRSYNLPFLMFIKPERALRDGGIHAAWMVFLNYMSNEQGVPHALGAPGRSQQEQLSSYC